MRHIASCAKKWGWSHLWREVIKESIVHSQEAWQPVIGAMHVLPVYSKPNNHHGRRAVAIYLRDGVVVG